MWMSENLSIRVLGHPAHSAATMPAPVMPAVMSATRTHTWLWPHVVAVVVLSGRSCFINQPAEEKRNHQRQSEKQFFSHSGDSSRR